MSKMNPTVKIDWTCALRSGKYKQARSALSNDHGHCCLGVLCVVAGFKFSSGYLGQRINNDGVGIGYDFSDIGLSNNDVSTLYLMNDDGYSFDEIADYVDHHL